MNIENIEFLVQNRKIHIYPRQKFYLKSFKPFYAQKWDF